MGKFIVDESTADTLVRVWEDEEAAISLQQPVVSKMPILDDATSQVRVVFDGVDDHMTGSLPTPISTDDCTLIYVGKATLPESGVGVICSFYDDTAADDFRYVRFGSIDGVPTCWYGNGVDTEVTLQATDIDFTSDLDYQWAFTADPITNDRTFWIDGDAKDTDNTDLIATLNSVQLGANGDNNYTVIEAGAVVSYDVFKNASELGNIDIYLFDRYGLDTVAPTVGDTTITISDTGSTTITLQWTQAIDDVTAQGSIDYEVYYSTADNISTYPNAVANGTLFETVTGAGESTITQLDTETQYYVNVFAKDAKNNVLTYTTNNTTTLVDDSFVTHRDFTEYANSTELQAEFEGTRVATLVADAGSPYGNVCRLLPNNNNARAWTFNPAIGVGQRDITKQFLLFKVNATATRIGGLLLCTAMTESEIRNLEGSNLVGIHGRYGNSNASLDWATTAVSRDRFAVGSSSGAQHTPSNWACIYAEKFPENGDVRIRMKVWEPADTTDPEADIPATWQIDNLYEESTELGSGAVITNNPDHVIPGFYQYDVSANREMDVGFYSIATGNETVLFKPPA